ncbi:lipoyl(octanoyl) transferase LipB [Paraburkholderia rhizosphaerae]|uniref:Octanoyltransferase n=1 Tax=Paraburkholderia rhizosphaerae TaxID=480658 RepID=A0A4R8LZ02_9BURK|nr:lipoyl(octanoyl) transferase LipB [Paraburkholderia rhizosphaerae]TDY53528.1 lipoyl(octanoyl) transferase [Paraburkholderia rhizosphaerae]
MCATPVTPPVALSDSTRAATALSETPIVATSVAHAEAVGAPASTPPILLRWRGVEPYQMSFDAMRAFTDARTAETADEIWLVEHPPVFTLGQAGDPAHLLAADSGIPLVKVDRGGQITFHGPGQIVAYLLLDLRRRKLMVRELVNRIEQAVIETLAAYNLAGERKAGAPGIYVAPGPAEAFETHAGAKIAALGLKIRNGCSYHGVSLNVNMNLQPFLAINPCGYAGLETVDMATLGANADWNDVAGTLAARLTANIDGVSQAAAQSQAGAAA